jgi:signal transduction histidine kinase
MVEVLQNLLGNAIKFMGDEPRPRIEVGARTSAGGHRLLRRGQRRRHRAAPPRVGVRAVREARSPLDGSGVGLAVARRVVELHGGRIWVESEGRGRGARFCFTLPAEAAPA